MRVLVACEYSGRVREAFRQKGHEAWSCDLLPADDASPYHYQGDVRDLLDQPWDLMIAHPPCTYLANSGIGWLYKQPLRWQDMIEGAVFFRTLLEADIPLRAVENPIMHRFSTAIIGRKHDQIIQPWMFGHPETKATTLWLEGLPPLKETNNVYDHMMTLSKEQQQRIHRMPDTKDRWKKRSETYQGIADAMAEQWGSYGV